VLTSTVQNIIHQVWG